jgi:site-specific DNA recombinase
MNAIFLQDLRQKVHRGQEVFVLQGKSAGGLSYGYRVPRTPAGNPERTFWRNYDSIGCGARI